MFGDDLTWLIIVLGLLLLFAFVIEIYVIMLMATFLASWFGFTGILWWACAILLFFLINGIIGAIFSI